MERRRFMAIGGWAVAGGLASLAGCRGRQVAHVLDDSQGDMVGSHAAGAETYNRLVEDSVARLLGRECEMSGLPVGEMFPAGPKRICFIGVENRSAEELTDFKEQLYERIDASISESRTFQPVSRRFVEAGLRTAHLRPEDLMTPDGRAAFQAAMQQQGQSFDYLLYATLTSGTTISNDDKQRDYQLTLELVDVETGGYSKDSAIVRKGYHQTRIGQWRIYNPFTKR